MFNYYYLSTQIIRTPKLLFTLLFLILSFHLYPQQNKETKKHTIFLIGNTSDHLDNLSHLQQLKDYLDGYGSEFTVLHLGDIIAPNTPLSDRNHPELKKLNTILSLADNPRGKLYILPGDLDWADSGIEGNKNIQVLHKYIDGQVNEDVMLIEHGNCPGPTVLDVTPFIRIVAFNSQWWIHPYDKPIGTDTDCDVLGKEELMEELTDAIEDAGNKNVLIASHHPVFSGGIYGGFIPLKMHIFPNGSKIPMPIAGSVYSAFLQNVGTPKYMAYPAYYELSSQMKQHFIFRKGLLFAAAHDHNLQVIESNHNYQFVSGSIFKKEPMRRKSGTVYKKKEHGLLAIEYHENGKVIKSTHLFQNNRLNELDKQLLFENPCNNADTSTIPGNYLYLPCKVENVPKGSYTSPDRLYKVVEGGAEYKAKGFKKMMLGTLYRPSWTMQVEVPYIDLQKEKGGIYPYSIGGGRQTTSLKFRAVDGKEYTFRSVNKDPIKALPPQLRETFLVDLLREMTATQQPYGALAVSRLLDATDILHARPKLFVLPDHPILGAYRKDYSELFGMLEDDPSKPKNDVPGFMGAIDVDRSFTMFRKIYDDNDVYVDAPSFAKARIFDMLIGDWGRHPDNWKWALYKEGDKDVFYPIPRDRDHSFSKWDGMIPYLADREWARPNIENFSYGFKGIRSLNWPARHLDRLLLSSLDQQDWLSISQSLQEEINEQVIDSAIQVLPKEIVPIQGAEIGAKLKSRIKQLDYAVKEHYKMLAKWVDVLGSNKHEYFLVERFKNGKVSVKVYKKKKEDKTLQPENKLIYFRTFSPVETKEIRLFGLNGDDVFHVKGEAKKSIKVRIIGGGENDLIKDGSVVGNKKKATIIYDNTDTEIIIGRSTQLKLANTPGINTYDREEFRYNTYLPTPIISFNADDGIALKFGVDFTRHGFRQRPYKQKYGFDVKVGTEGTRSISAFSEWSNVFGKWYMGLNGIYADIFPFYNFFGLGNETVKDDIPREFFRTNYKGTDIKWYVRNEFWQKSTLQVDIGLEDYQSEIRDNTILEGSDITGIDPLTILSLSGELDLDFRNGSNYATKGLRLFLGHQSGWLINDDSDHFSLNEAFAEWYSTYRSVTLALKFGGGRNTGDNIPYFKYTNLGQSTNLRGYLRNRFTGTASMYLNSELRLPIGDVKNPILPFLVGVTGFFDTGRVWYTEDESGVDPTVISRDNTWHNGYGGGIYVVPISKRYTFSLSIATSEEESLLFMAGIGFGIGN